NSKYQHNKKRSAPKQEIKERTKKAKKAKYDNDFDFKDILTFVNVLHLSFLANLSPHSAPTIFSILGRGLQLDPENNKSITDIQSEMITKGGDGIDGSESKDDEGSDKDVIMAGPDSDNDNNDDGDDDDDDDIMEDDSEAPVIAKSIHNFEGLLAQVHTVAHSPALGPKSITELRAKLEERLAKLRGRRGATAAAAAAAAAAAGEANGGIKPTSRQAILEARMKKKKDKKVSQKLAKEKKAAGGSEGLVVKETNLTLRTNGRPSASSINDKGEAEAHKEKITALQTADPEKASALKEKDTWKKALQLAQGEKVKDDIKLLKKTIKREEVLKKKSSKEWGERKSSVKKSKDQKQKKREENLKARMESKSKGKKGDKKTAKGGAKGGKGGKPKARAGFEGKHNKKTSKPSRK
ncbi:surfeit locus protein, partial [Modicella reniformis]